MANRPPATSTTRQPRKSWRRGRLVPFELAGYNVFVYLVGFYQTVAQAHDAVSVHGNVLLVGYHDNGVAPGIQGLEQLHNFVAGAGVEGAGGFVGQNDAGVVNQGAGNGHALALAAAQLVGLVQGAVGEPDAAQGLAGQFVPLAFAVAGIDKGEGYVVEGGGAGQQVE